MEVQKTATLTQLLQQSSTRHTKLCPRQVLGVRMGLLAGQVLGLDVPSAGKRLITLVETDGCAADGVSAATGCTVGNRRLRIVDFGKVAATFVDKVSDHAVRIVPRNDIREVAQKQNLDAHSRWHAQLEAYQVMDDADLLEAQRVELSISLEKLLSKPGCRVNCDACGEEIINQREVILREMLLCRACAGQGYYHLIGREKFQLLLEQQISLE